jgi:hypothetical protein
VDLDVVLEMVRAVERLDESADRDQTADGFDKLTRLRA